MRAYLITGNPGSGKSALAAELARRGLITVDADDLAFWEDKAGVRVDQPPVQRTTGGALTAGSGAGPASNR